MVQFHAPHLGPHPHSRSARAKSLRSAIWLLALILAITSSVQGAEWVFEHSYYSHSDSPAYTIGLVPQSRSAYRQPYVNLAPHTRITGGWRWNNYQIMNGNNMDNTYMREFYIDGR